MGIGNLPVFKAQGQGDGLRLARTDGGHAVFGVAGDGRAAHVEAVTLHHNADVHVVQRDEVVLVRDEQAHHLILADRP